MSIEAMKLALEALDKHDYEMADHILWKALSQPEPEPAAWTDEDFTELIVSEDIANIGATVPLKLALEEVKKLRAYPETDECWKQQNAITALKQALEQPEPEPVAWTLLLVGENNGIIGKAGETFESHPKYYKRVDVYTSPPKRKPLTDEQMEQIHQQYGGNIKKIMRAVESVHGIKGEA